MSVTVRHKLAAWARPAMDTLEFLVQDSHVAAAWREYDRGQLLNMVGGLLVRIDPYKAPEQLAPNIEQITDWFYEELHR